MVSDLPEGEKVFIDANIYLFNALDDSKYGESSTRFLERIEQGEVKAVTNVLVLNEVAFKILMAELSNYSEKIKFILTGDADFKRVDWAAVVELEIVS